MRRQGFTIIEMLVTITIMVVILALIAPALDRAIYQAQLAVCESNLSAMAGGYITYAMSHNRAYPHRPGVVDGDWEAHKLYQKFPDLRVHDERPTTRGYVPLKAMLDPLCDKIDLGEEATSPDDIVYRNSDQWAGFKWFGHEGMKRLGNRLTWVDDANYTIPRTYRFSLLASDRDFMNFEQLIVDSSHPDSEGYLTAMSWQSEDIGGGFGLFADTLAQGTYSGWYRLGNVYRGPSDLNYAYDDGAVHRMVRVLYVDDPRMARVPHFANITGFPTVGSWPTQFDNLPRQ